MKKLLSLTLALFCLCSAVPAALAAENSTYELPELNMTIEAPKGWYVSTRDVKDGDPNIELLAMDKKELADYYRENDIYLNMVSEGPYADINVKMRVNRSNPDIYDLNSIPDENMLHEAESMMQKLQKDAEGQITYSGCSVYIHKQAKFFVFNSNYLNNGLTVYGKRYFTVINGQVINITLHSYEGEISDNLSQTLLNTMDSVFFTKVASKPVPAAQKIYELPELNMTIEAPEGWTVLTQDIDESDPNLKLIGLDRKELADSLKENGIYLDMINADSFAEMLVVMKEFDGSRDIYDFNTIPNEELLPAVESMIKGQAVSAQGLTFTNGSIYSHKQAKFVIFDGTYRDNGIMVYGQQYFTTINGQAIAITLRSYGSEVTDGLAQTVQDTVDSIYFTEVTAMPTKLSAILSLTKDVAIIAGTIGLIAFAISRARKKKYSQMGMINGR